MGVGLPAPGPGAPQNSNGDVMGRTVSPRSICWGLCCQDLGMRLYVETGPLEGRLR